MLLVAGNASSRVGRPIAPPFGVPVLTTSVGRGAALGVEKCVPCRPDLAAAFVMLAPGEKP